MKIFSIDPVCNELLLMFNLFSINHLNVESILQSVESWNFMLHVTVMTTIVRTHKKKTHSFSIPPLKYNRVQIHRKL